MDDNNSRPEVPDAMAFARSALACVPADPASCSADDLEVVTAAVRGLSRYLDDVTEQTEALRYDVLLAVQALHGTREARIALTNYLRPALAARGLGIIAEAIPPVPREDTP